MKNIVQNILFLVVLLAPEAYAQQVVKSGANLQADEAGRPSSLSIISDASVENQNKLVEPTPTKPPAPLMPFLGTVVAPIVQAITSLAGVLGLFLLWHQIKVTNTWNRINTQHTLLSNLPSQELDRQVWALVEKLPKDKHWRLNAESAPLIYNSIPDWVCVKTFLSKIEQLCAAINSNAVDDRYAYDVHGAKVIDLFSIFEPYITYARQQSEDVTIYLELEKVATRWSIISKAEKMKVRAEQAELLAQRGRAAPIT